MKLAILSFVLFLFSIAWSQPATNGVWLGKIENAARPSQQLHLKLELKQDETRLNGINGKLFLRTPATIYEFLGNLTGTVQRDQGYLEWQLRGNLKAHPDLPQAFAGALTLDAFVMPMPSQAPPGSPAAMAIVDGGPLPMTFVQAGTAQTEQQRLFDRLDFIWAMQYLSPEQIEHMSSYSKNILKETRSVQQLNELTVAEGLKVFQTSCKKKAGRNLHPA